MHARPKARMSRTFRRIAGPLAAVAILSSLVAAPAVAHNYNPFTAVITPGTITSGGTVSFTATVTNNSQWYVLDKVTVVAPAGYTLVSPADGKFSGVGAAKNGGVKALAFTATVPNGCLVTSAVWKTTAKASNGTTFTPNPVTQTTQVANSCALAFVNQPATTVKAQSITSQAVNPAGPAVQVAVVDTANGGATVPGFTGTVGFSITGGSPAQAFSTSAALSGGMAGFAGSLPLPGSGYAIAASVPGATGATSSTFTVIDAGTTCDPGAACNASTTNQSTNTNLGVNAAAGSTSDIITIQWSGDLQCKAPLSNKPYVSTTGIFTADVTGDREKTFDLTIPKANAVAAGKPFAFQYHVCFGAPTSFNGLFGKPAVLMGDQYVGLLGGCWKLDTDDVPWGWVMPANATNPCVVWKYRASNGDIKIRFWAPPGDPRGYA